MSLPRYPQYKASGVEFLGHVPEHWSATQVKRLASIRYGIGEPPRYHNEGTPLIRATNVQSGRLFHEGMVFVDPMEIPEPRIVWLSQGDIVVVRSGAYTGDSAIIPPGFGPCIAGFDMVLTCHSIHPQFMQFALLSPYLKQGQIELERMRAAQPHLNAEELGSCVVALPPTEEQFAIATFLERETTAIDALIAEQQQLLELLKEKRQAVISHAVTKGVDPGAKMKRSGIGWLGDVPEHWDITPLKYVVTLRSGGTPSKTNLAYWDGDVPWASSKDLKTEALADTQDHITQKSLEDGASELIPAGSLLIVVRGMILAHTFPVTKTLVPMAINQDLKALTSRLRLNVDYLAWLLRGAAPESLGRVDEAGHGTKVLRIEAWTSMALPIPPVEEQLRIVSAIHGRLQQLDSLTAEAQRAVHLLQERRTALISAAVTGKIDVRGLVDTEAA